MVFFEVLVEKLFVASFLDGRQQNFEGFFDIADEPKINGGSAADVFWAHVNLNLLYVVAGEKFKEWKVCAEQQYQIGVMHCFVRSP